MPDAKRVFPISYVPPSQTFNLLLLAEGFRAQDEDLFVRACKQLEDNLFQTPPFNTTRFQSSWINIFRHFTPSMVAGPVIGSVPGDTAFHSTYDPLTRTLNLDPARVANEVDGLTMRGEEGESSRLGFNFWPRVRERRGVTGGAVIILLPAAVNSVAVSAEMEHPLGSGIQPSVTPNVHFTATTIDGSLWHLTVARVIGRVLGLADEFERPGTAFLKPTPDDGYKINTFPNLAYIPIPYAVPPPLDFKWYNSLDSKERQTTLRVVPHRGSAGTPDYTVPVIPSTTSRIELWEGGVGYRTEVYRPAEDCLMRRQIGGPLSPKQGNVAFCLICQRHLLRTITGTTGRLTRKTLRNQSLKFDDINTWQSPHALVSGFPTTPATSFPISYAVRGGLSGVQPYWEFDLDVGFASGGMRIRNLKLKGQPQAGAGEDVAELIEFRDIAVTFTDGSTTNFNIADAFSGSGTAKFEAGVLGSTGPLDPACLWGLKLTLENNLGCACPVRVEMSLVLTGAGGSIEPTGLVRAVKFFPQIGLTWSTGGTKRVKSFRAAVRLVVNNIHMAHHPSNVASVFTDSNAADRDKRKKSGQVSGVNLNPQNTPIPFWAEIFDYVRPNLRVEFEFVGVYGPSNLAKRKVRSEDYSWPPGAPEKITLEKLPRQGKYDNVHVHGLMGTDPSDIPTPGPVIHAPACGEACFHLHWRWGPRNVVLAAVLSSVPSTFRGTPAQFKGWGYTANSVAGAPLIHPNQHLTVAVAHPSTQRQNPKDPVLTSPPVPIDTGSAMRNKAIWYTVDIEGPDPGERQVVLEQGIGWGFDYFPITDLLRTAIAIAFPGVGPLLPKWTPNDVLQFLYKEIRGSVRACSRSHTAPLIRRWKTYDFLS